MIETTLLGLAVAVFAAAGVVYWRSASWLTVRMFLMVFLLHILVPFLLLMAYSPAFGAMFEAWLDSSVWVPLGLLVAVLAVIWWIVGEFMGVWV